MKICKVESVNRKKGINITWALTRLCNLKCSYCRVNDKWSKFIPFRTRINQIRNYIISYSKEVETSVLIFGGEPTFIPYWQEICFSLAESNVNTSIFTNLTASINKYREIQQKQIYINTTYHYGISSTEYLDKVMSLDKDLTSIYVMFDPRDIQSCKIVYEKLIKEGYNVELNNILSEDLILSSSDKEYLIKNSIHDCSTERILITFEDGHSRRYSFSALTRFELNSFKGWKCNAGKESLFIECQGDIFPCQSYIFSQPPLDNVFKNPSFRVKEPIICNLDKCLCDFDVTKIKG